MTNINAIQGNGQKVKFTDEQITKLLSVNLIENVCEIASMIDGKKVRVYRWIE
jgi:hypothetical protein